MLLLWISFGRAMQRAQVANAGLWAVLQKQMSTTSKPGTATLGLTVPASFCVTHLYIFNLRHTESKDGKKCLSHPFHLLCISGLRFTLNSSALPLSGHSRLRQPHPVMGSVTRQADGAGMDFCNEQLREPDGLQACQIP